MRFVSGIILGIVLTVGTAFIVDSMHTAPGPDAKGSAQMVNWTVVSDNLRGFSSDVQDGWDHLVGKVHEIDRKTGV